MSNTILGIIIVTFNNEKHIKACVDSILNQTYKYIGKIVVVDNNSSDSTVPFLEEYDSKKIIIIKSDRNLGFAKGVNLGLDYLKKKKLDIILVNPDTRLENSSIEALVKCSAEADIVGGQTYNTKMLRTYVRFPTIFTLLFDYTNLRKAVPFDYFHKSHYYLDLPKMNNDVEVDAVSGAYMLIKNKVYKTVGNFDENFFMYLEDIDYCNRAHKYGYIVRYCPHSKVYHFEGGSSKNKNKVNHEAWFKSRLYYSKKYFKKIHFIISSIFFIDSLLINFKRSLNENLTS